MLRSISHWGIRALALGLTVLIVSLYYDRPFIEAVVPMLFAAEFFTHSVFNASLHDRILFGEWRGQGEGHEENPERGDFDDGVAFKNVVSLDGYRR
jgi:hypothetical protein